MIFNVAKHAGLQPRMEPQHILDDNNDRPGDVYVKGLFNGKDACIDVAITHSSQPKYIDIAALNGGAIQEKYLLNCLSINQMQFKD